MMKIYILKGKGNFKILLWPLSYYYNRPPSPQHFSPGTSAAVLGAKARSWGIMTEEIQPSGPPQPHTRKPWFLHLAATLLIWSCSKFIFSSYPIDSYLYSGTILTQNLLPSTSTKRKNQSHRAKQAFLLTHYMALGLMKPQSSSTVKGYRPVCAWRSYRADQQECIHNET